MYFSVGTFYFAGVAFMKPWNEYMSHMNIYSYTSQANRVHISLDILYLKSLPSTTFATFQSVLVFVKNIPLRDIINPQVASNYASLLDHHNMLTNSRDGNEQLLLHGNMEYQTGPNHNWFNELKTSKMFHDSKSIILIWNEHCHLFNTKLSPEFLLAFYHYDAC